MLTVRSYQRIKLLVSHQLPIRSRQTYMILWIIFRLTYFKLALGTSTNMNMNEVISNIAKQDHKKSIHPNDDVNMSQSSNDVIPTTINISSLAMSKSLSMSINFLCDSINSKSKSLAHIIKSGRTHLMDAVPISFEQELNVWEEQVRASQSQIDLSCEEISYLPYRVLLLVQE